MLPTQSYTFQENFYILTVKLAVKNLLFILNNNQINTILINKRSVKNNKQLNTFKYTASEILVFPN